MIITGITFLVDKEKSITANIKAAKTEFKKITGKEATMVMFNPSDGRTRGWGIISTKKMNRGHFWVGITEVKVE